MFIEFKDSCPLTRKPICPADFVENRALRRQIIKWKQQNQLVDAKADESGEENEEDDDELFQQVVANATQIGKIAKSHNSQQRQRQQIEEEESYRHLMELGAKLLRQRDEELRQRQTATQQRARPVISVFEQYQ
jgi:hypothetical protein